MRNAIRLIVLLGVLWLFLFLVASCAEAQVYTVTDIGPNIYPAGINAKGQVSGSGLCSTCGPNQQALLWSASTGLKDLGGSINNAGTAAGGYIRGADFTPRSYIWTSLGGFRDLGIPQSEAAGINNKGHVVGRYNVACVFCDSGHAFLWDRQHGVRDLGTLPG